MSLSTSVLAHFIQSKLYLQYIFELFYYNNIFIIFLGNFGQKGQCYKWKTSLRLDSGRYRVNHRGLASPFYQLRMLMRWLNVLSFDEVCRLFTIYKHIVGVFYE